MNVCACVGLEIRLKFVRSKAGEELSNCVHYKIYLATICLNEIWRGLINYIKDDREILQYSLIRFVTYILVENSNQNLLDRL